MGRIERADLTDTGRLLDLFADAVRCGHVTDSERGRLRFVALAEHCLGCEAIQYPLAAFSAMVRASRWDRITEAAEQRSVERIRGHEHGPGQRRTEPADVDLARYGEQRKRR